MKYKADIYDIPLSVFVEIYTNNDKCVEFEGGETDESREKLISDYMEIVAGKQLYAEVLGCNERMNLSMTVECMNACENMMKLGMYDEVHDTLVNIGYSCKDGDVKSMKERIYALKARAQYDLSKINTENGDSKKEIPTKRSFINEIVSIGKYNKMYINTKEWTAGEYACLVKQTCDEIEMLNRKKK